MPGFSALGCFFTPRGAASLSTKGLYVDRDAESTAKSRRRATKAGGHHFIDDREGVGGCPSHGFLMPWGVVWVSAVCGPGASETGPHGGVRTVSTWGWCGVACQVAFVVDLDCGERLYFSSCISVLWQRVGVSGNWVFWRGP